MAAVRSRDARFDGFFYLGVTSTKIYCRPSCPARVPKESNMRFYPSAAAAQGAGFRACKRCRPDATPGSPLWHERSDVVARVMRLIFDGVIDREGVAGVARRVGYSERQVERLVLAELGAGPLALARAQRAHTARVLIETTTLPMSEIAYAAGFTSIRSFNDTIREVFDATPTHLRSTPPRRSLPGGPQPKGVSAHRVTLRLPFRGRLHAPSLFGHLAATSVPGVEQWIDTVLVRSIRLARGPALIHVSPRADHVAATLSLADLRDLTTAMQRCRRLLDLDADPVAIDEHLARDPLLAPLVASAAGVRIPGAMDPAEMAIRIVLSQHISTKAAATLTARLVRTLGEPFVGHGNAVGGTSAGEGINWLFPSPAAIAAADPGLLPGMPPTRLRSLRLLASALADSSVDVGPAADWAQARSRLLAIPGIGPWTVEMIALRAMGDPNAFPATDLGVRNTAIALGLPAPPRDLISHAAAWQPWRGYATQSLWAASDHVAARMPEPTTGATT